jgi:hypothetical protein
MQLAEPLLAGRRRIERSIERAPVRKHKADENRGTQIHPAAVWGCFCPSDRQNADKRVTGAPEAAYRRPPDESPSPVQK